MDSVTGWADDVFVVDSFSTDRTMAIANQKGVRVVQNRFENMAQQRNWSLSQLPLKTEWVMFLDADERPTAELKDELARKLPTFSIEIAGLYTKRRFIWLGKWLRHGGMYKKVLRIVRRDRARVEMAGRREYMRVQGNTLLLNNDLLHDDRKGVADWINKHNRFSDQEVDEIANTAKKKALTDMCLKDPAFQETEGSRIIIIRKYWNRLPLFIRPHLSFFIKYFLMLGFLDGIAGFTYHFFHDFWYPMLVDIKYLERRCKNIY